MRSCPPFYAVLLVAGAVLFVAGCSDGETDEQASLDNSLARIEQARQNPQWNPSTAVAPKLVPPKPAGPSEPQKGTFTVKVESTTGNFRIEVHRDWAPVGAERFYQLVKAGFYDECRYFRVVPGFMVQFGINGDPALQRQSSRKILDDPVIKSNERGYVTFATSGPDSRTTQIFINFGDNSRLDSEGFAPFGKVIEGMENVDAINSEYGESPQQPSIESNGNAYLDHNFPELDYVKKMSIVSETTE